MNQSNSTQIPIGTVVPFAGLFETQWLKDQGWLYCDGQSLNKRDYADLFFCIGNNYGGGRDTFNLPDFRGFFQRGVDHGTRNDPNVLTRVGVNPGALGGDNPGSMQTYATGKPVKAFIAKENGEHDHSVPHAPTEKNAYALAGGNYAIWRDDAATTSENGDHTHTIESGGDSETRPVNANVYFIIKYKDGQAS